MSKSRAKPSSSASSPELSPVAAVLSSVIPGFTGKSPGSEKLNLEIEKLEARRAVLKQQHTELKAKEKILRRENERERQRLAGKVMLELLAHDKFSRVTFLELLNKHARSRKDREHFGLPDVADFPAWLEQQNAEDLTF